MLLGACAVPGIACVLSAEAAGAVVLQHDGAAVAQHDAALEQQQPPACAGAADKAPSDVTAKAIENNLNMQFSLNKNKRNKLLLATGLPCAISANIGLVSRPGFEAEPGTSELKHASIGPTITTAGTLELGTTVSASDSPGRSWPASTAHTKNFGQRPNRFEPWAPGRALRPARLTLRRIRNRWPKELVRPAKAHTRSCASALARLPDTSAASV